MSADVAAKLQAMVPDVQVVQPMAGEHLVKLANGNVERVKQKTCLVRTALHTSCLLYTSPSPRDLSTSRMPSSA